MKKFFCLAMLLFCVSAFAAEWNLNLADLNHVYQEWSKARKDMSFNDQALSVAGVKYATGIATHAAGEIIVTLHGDASLIAGKVGVDDSSANRGSVVFEVIDAVQGTRLWASPIVRGGEQAVPFEVDVSGVEMVILKVTDAGDDGHHDHADWLDVKITYDGKTPHSRKSVAEVATKNLSWQLTGITGGKLLQRGFGDKALPPMAPAPLYMPVPIRSMNEFAIPETTRIIQADGSHNLELILTMSDVETLSPGVNAHRYKMKDPFYPIEAMLEVIAYVEEDVFEITTTIVNVGEQDVLALSRDAALIALPAGEVHITTFSGAWAEEMTKVNECLLPRGTYSARFGGTTHASQFNYPGFFLSYDGMAQEESGRVFAAALGSDGNWQYKVTHADDKRNYFAAGALETDMIRIRPGERYTTPPLFVTYSTAGKGQASRNFHDYLRRYGVSNGQSERAVVHNSWEGAYMSFDEAVILRMINAAADLGAELFVLDDGWFGNKHPRNDANAGLGDWQVNTAKLPNGIERLIDEAESAGIRFGLWVEPEMVNPNSELFERHPEWAMQVPNRERVESRNQYLLDLTNPEVEAFVYNAVSDILLAHPRIAYIKWDHNFFASNAGAAHLQDNQGAVSELYVAAYRRIMTRLRAEFPNVVFQVCSGGGSRVDFGTMRYHEECWASDMTIGVRRIPIQWGHSHFLPGNTLASHINRYGDGDFKLRADVAMCGRLGVELDPAVITEENREAIRRGIAAYKKLRPMLHAADLYRGRSPHSSALTELTLAAKDKREAVMFGFNRSKEAVTAGVYFGGLEAEATYRVTEVNPAEAPRFTAGEFTGKELMENGLEVSFPAYESSVAAHAEKI